MALLSETDQASLRAEFGGMTRSVRLLLFTQALGCETCAETRQILNELPPLSDKITVEEINLVLDGDRAQAYGVDRPPAIVVAYETPDAPGTLLDTRIRFIGVPAGYEFSNLIQAVLLAGGQEPRLSAATRARLAAVDRPVTMQVFTTPT